jgi:chlorobactene glucosyltransferase
MPALLLIPLGVLLAWVWLLLFRIGRYWLGRFPETDSGTDPLPAATVIIPARNEERHLPGLFEALAQDPTGVAEILVVNDSSTDRTAAVAAEAARTDPRVRLLACPPPPEDWSGKCWALWQGVKATTGEWLLFCDADVLPAPGAVRETLRAARERELDALCLIPRMPARNFGAALLTVCMAVARALIMVPARDRQAGVVQGAFLLVRRPVYEAVGGHAAVRQSLLEDMELGRRVQEAGFALESHPGRPWVATRMYDSFGEAWEGFQKHLFALAGFSLARAGAGVLALLLLVFLPFASLVAGAFLPLAGAETDPGVHAYFLWSLPATAAMYTGVLSVTLAEGLPLAAGLLAPFSYFACAGLLIRSILGYRRGAIRWKGRAYPAARFGGRPARTPKT